MAVHESSTLLLAITKTDTPKVRLVCFPFAGGGCVNFYKWKDNLLSDIDLYCVNLPGRERLYDQPFFTDLTDLVKNIAKEISNSPLPVIFFGHSYGGICAFLTALELRKTSQILPVDIYISARLPPCEDTFEKISHLDNGDFKQVLIERYQGIPEVLLENQDLMGVYLPIIKADFFLYEQYKMALELYEDTVIDTDVVLFSYKNDASMQGDVERWGQYTTGQCIHYPLEGEHLGLLQDPNPLISIINQRYQAEFK